MLFHRLKPSEVESLTFDPQHLTLLLSAFAEIHANASLFGGEKSESFKIKRKKLESVAKKVIKKIKV